MISTGQLGQFFVQIKYQFIFLLSCIAGAEQVQGRRYYTF